MPRTLTATVSIYDDNIEVGNEGGMFHRYYVADHEYREGHTTPVVSTKILFELWKLKEQGYNLFFEDHRTKDYEEDLYL